VTSWFPCAIPVFFLAAAGFAPSARAAEGLEGTWDTPLGRVRIDQGQGGCLGRILENAPVCRFLRGEEVLRGNFVDAHYNLACALARRGRSREALSSLRGAADLGSAAADSLEADPDLASVRAEPAYQEALSIARANAARAR
jgi:hypothetical protein